MKIANWTCRWLDIIGIGALITAGLFLLAVLWLAGSSNDAMLLDSFRHSLMIAVGAFLSGRSYKIVQLLVDERNSPPSPTSELTSNDNVEPFPSKKSLAQAA